MLQTFPSDRRSAVEPQPSRSFSIFNFLTAWNEYTLVVLTLGLGQHPFTLPVGIQFLSTQFNSNQPAISAGLMITMLPVIVAFIFFQRYIIRGVTAGAIKG